MKVFLDTNVLIAASICQHPHFTRADAVMQRCARKDDEGFIHAHSILEYHSAITQLPGGLAVPSAQVTTLLHEGLLCYLRCVTLNAGEVQSVQKRAAERGLVGGIIYDLYHLVAAEKSAVDRLYTFNTAHFRSLADPSFTSAIVTP